MHATGLIGSCFSWIHSDLIISYDILLSTVEIGGMKPKKDDQIATCQEAANGRSEFKPQLTNDQKDLEEENHVLTNIKMELGQAHDVILKNMAVKLLKVNTKEQYMNRVWYQKRVY